MWCGNAMAKTRSLNELGIVVVYIDSFLDTVLILYNINNNCERSPKTTYLSVFSSVEFILERRSYL